MSSSSGSVHLPGGFLMRAKPYVTSHASCGVGTACHLHRACYQLPVNGLRSFPLSVVRPSYLPLTDFGCTLLFSLHSFPRYLHSIPDTQNRGFYPCTSDLETARKSSASFCLSDIPQSSKPQFWMGSQEVCEYDSDIPLSL